MRVRSTGLVAGLLLCFTGTAHAVDAPVAVSPGTASGGVVNGTCPTFHWSGVDGASTYELVVFRLGPDGERPHEVYRVTLPGRALGWTPTLERCLEPGSRYAWALRAQNQTGEVGSWSAARIFEIAGMPTISEVEQALGVLSRWMDRAELGTVQQGTPTADAGSSLERPTTAGAQSRSRQDTGAEELEQPLHEDDASDPAAVQEPLNPHERPAPLVPPVAPTLGNASLTIDQQLHLGDGSHLFKNGEVLLWEDEVAGITGFGHGALGANTTGLNNTATGTLALHQNDTGSNNTAVGASAMHENAGGADNTAVGFEALGSNTTGNRNTVLGSNAMHDSTTATNSTAVGVEALGSNTTGGNNTAVGADALHLNTEGFRNTALGFEALGDNTTGGNNVAVGAKAMHGSGTGSNNVAVGVEALGSTDAGSSNTAVGHVAMHDNTTGANNSVLGTRALRFNVDGTDNVAIGVDVLFNNVSGSRNTAVGKQALHNAISGDNVAVGLEALGGITTGARNTAVGTEAGHSATTGSDNIHIGSGAHGQSGDSNTIRIGGETVGVGSGQQNRTFINGIRGVTTGVADAVQVFIDSNGQLGTMSSSRRFKEDIHDMERASRRLLELRPVSFRFKDRESDGNQSTEYGLIAEEVAERFPELVVYDAEGRPETVKYHLLSTLLLNELQRLDNESRTESERVAALEALNRALEERMREQERDIHRLRAEVSRKR